MDQYALDFFRAAVILGGDYPRKPIDALYIHTLAKDDGESGILSDIFDTAVEMKDSGFTRNIVINCSEGEGVSVPAGTSTILGRKFYREELGKRGASDCIVETEKSARHTREENDAFLDLALSKGWHRLGCLSVSFHMTRVMLGMVQSMKEEQEIFCLYSIIPRHTSWQGSMYGSQGEKYQTMFELIKQDYERIVTYQKDGYLCSFEDFFEYMKTRE